MLCKEVQRNGTEFEFCMETSEEEEQHINKTEDCFFHATEYVQILDKIPFEDGQVDDKELDYYDSLIKN